MRLPCGVSRSGEDVSASVGSFSCFLSEEQETLTMKGHPRFPSIAASPQGLGKLFPVRAQVSCGCGVDAVGCCGVLHV